MRVDRAYMRAGRVGICAKCRGEVSETSPSLPYAGTDSISYIMSPFEYTGALRQAILDFKFKGCTAYAPLLAEMMREYLNSYDIWEDFDYIIPVPLHEGRLRERGYNQSELLAAHIAEYLGIPMLTDLIRRSRATKRQSTLKRIDRILNVKGAFRCDSDLSGARILIFDDICTTGNTLEACASAAKAAGTENICALTLAIHTSEILPVITY